MSQIGKKIIQITTKKIKSPIGLSAIQFTKIIESTTIPVKTITAGPHSSHHFFHIWHLFSRNNYSISLPQINKPYCLNITIQEASFQSPELLSTPMTLTISAKLIGVRYWRPRRQYDVLTLRHSRMGPCIRLLFPIELLLIDV